MNETRFTDLAGRQWDLRITFGDYRSLADKGIDLTKPWECAGEIGRLVVEEPERLVEIAYSLASTQHPDVDPEAFARSLGGQTLWELSQALSEAVVDFFPNPAVRTWMKERLRGLMSELANPSTSGDSALKPPEQVASILAGLPSANLTGLPMAESGGSGGEPLSSPAPSPAPTPAA